MEFTLKKLQTAEGIQLAISYLIKIILLLAIVITVVNREWEALLLSFLALVLTFAPALVSKNYKINLPMEFEFVFVLFVFASIFLGELGFYTRFWWWDSMLHTISGMVMAFIGFLILYILYYQERLKASPELIAFFAFCFSMALGTIWEIFEFGMDSFLGFNMQRTETGVTDTMRDLIVNAMGSFFVVLFGYFYLKNKTENTFSRLLKKFLLKNPTFRRRPKTQGGP